MFFNEISLINVLVHALSKYFFKNTALTFFYYNYDSMHYFLQQQDYFLKISFLINKNTVDINTGIPIKKIIAPEIATQRSFLNTSLILFK